MVQPVIPKTWKTEPLVVFWGVPSGYGEEEGRDVSEREREAELVSAGRWAA